MTPSEELRIEMWRLDQFARLGFDGSQTSTLLLWETDVEEARKLIAAGCAHDLAMRILCPDEGPTHEELEREALVVLVAG